MSLIRTPLDQTTSETRDLDQLMTATLGTKDWDQAMIPILGSKDQDQTEAITNDFGQNRNDTLEDRARVQSDVSSAIK